MKIFWVGTPKGKNLTSKLYYNDITDRYNKSLEALGDEKELVEQFSEKCKLQVVK